eukprot:5881910-Pyramimonas_sp.AAC.1
MRTGIGPSGASPLWVLRTLLGPGAIPGGFVACCPPPYCRRPDNAGHYCLKIWSDLRPPTPQSVNRCVGISTSSAG